jgi:Kef-type K+ transport system membrane component KefB
MDLLRFAVQVCAVLAACWACGQAARALRQPAVIGEIAGGLLLGPSVFGRWLPGLFAQLFPASHLDGLERLSDGGLILFLFALGLEMDLPRLVARGRLVLLTTLGSLGVPFAAGAVVALAFASRYLDAGRSLLAFVLFVGTAYSITALPVLGRILRDRAASGKPVRSQVAELAFACATANDGAAWILLLLALAAAHGGAGFGGVGRSIALLVVFVAVTVFAVRPLLQRLFDRLQNEALRLLLCVMLAFASAMVTTTLGVHAFFGAVLAGACAPRAAGWPHVFETRLKPLLMIALPVFFALTGLKTRLTWDAKSLGFTALVVVTAAASKMVAGAFAARMGGRPWNEALEVGVLLNTRGLVELIVLNLGLRAGVLTPALFSTLVVMAIVTTAMTVPGLDALQRMRRVNA